LHVGVLTGYAEQRDELERRITEKRSGWPHLAVECNTVDAFQGRQVDIAIYSVTRSNVQGRLGFLRERRRLNVALSRGRLGLVIVGDDNFAATADGDNPFAAVLRHVRRDARCCIDEARP
jgi:superfamily I DNA and/or RNA helicase